MDKEVQKTALDLYQDILDVFGYNSNTEVFEGCDDEVQRSVLEEVANFLFEIGWHRICK